MNAESIRQIVAQTLAGNAEIDFAYLHGSVLESDCPRDIDVAICLGPVRYRLMRDAGRLHFDIVVPLEMNLEQALGRNVDLQVINDAPLSFRARVVSQGRVVCDRNVEARCDFECRARCEYFDFRPRRLEYLAALGVA